MDISGLIIGCPQSLKNFNYSKCNHNTSSITLLTLQFSLVFPRSPIIWIHHWAAAAYYVCTCLMSLALRCCGNSVKNTCSGEAQETQGAVLSWRTGDESRSAAKLVPFKKTPSHECFLSLPSC